MTDMSTDRRAVYAGSFDPATNGHISIIEQAAVIFPELEVAVGVNPDKKTTFTVEERMDMLGKITGHLGNVSIGQFTNKLLVRYAFENGFTHIVRGIRSAEDYAQEATMYEVNKDIDPAIESVYLMCPRDLRVVSSSLVKGLVGVEGWEETVAKYVPEFVLEALAKNLSVRNR